MSDNPREKLQAICEMTQHVWKDVHFGLGCINCGLFYSDEDNDEDNEDLDLGWMDDYSIGSEYNP